MSRRVTYLRLELQIIDIHDHVKSTQRVIDSLEMIWGNSREDYLLVFTTSQYLSLSEDGSFLRLIFLDDDHDLFTRLGLEEIKSYTSSIRGVCCQDDDDEFCLCGCGPLSSQHTITLPLKKSHKKVITTPVTIYLEINLKPNYKPTISLEGKFDPTLNIFTLMTNLTTNLFPMVTIDDLTLFLNCQQVRSFLFDPTSGQIRFGKMVDEKMGKKNTISLFAYDQSHNIIITSS